MAELTNEDFIAFLESYKDIKNCYDSISNISWPKNKDGTNDESKKPLIKNKNYMYSLDDMCKTCCKFKKNNIPTSTDALWYNINDKGKLIIYFIEFKGHNLNNINTQKRLSDIIKDIENNYKLGKKPLNATLKGDLSEIEDSFVDEDITYSLRLKPFESLFIVLPMLYEEITNGNSEDLFTFLRTCEIKILSFVGVFTRKYESSNVDDSKRNKSKERSRYLRMVGPKGSIGNTVYKQCKRYEHNYLIKFANIFPKEFFNRFLEDEKLFQ